MTEALEDSQARSAAYQLGKRGQLTESMDHRSASVRQSSILRTRAIPEPADSDEGLRGGDGGVREGGGSWGNMEAAAEASLETTGALAIDGSGAVFLKGSAGGCTG